MVWRGVAGYSTGWHGRVHPGPSRCGEVWRGAARHGTARHGVAWCTKEHPFMTCCITAQQSIHMHSIHCDQARGHTPYHHAWQQRPSRVNTLAHAKSRAKYSERPARKRSAANQRHLDLFREPGTPVEVCDQSGEWKAPPALLESVWHGPMTSCGNGLA